MQSFYFIAEASEQDLDWIVVSGRQRSVPAGTILIRQRERTDALYMVLEGTLTVEVEKNGCIEAVAQLTVGDVAGEMSFLDSRPPSATVKALTNSLVWAIPWTKLAAKLRLDPAFAAHFYHATSLLLSDRMRRLLAQVGMADQATVETDDDDISPEVVNRYELVKTRFDFLLRRLKATRY